MEKAKSSQMREYTQAQEQIRMIEKGFELWLELGIKIYKAKELPLTVLNEIGRHMVIIIFD